MGPARRRSPPGGSAEDVRRDGEPLPGTRNHTPLRRQIRRSSAQNSVSYLVRNRISRDVTLRIGQVCRLPPAELASVADVVLIPGRASYGGAMASPHTMRDNRIRRPGSLEKVRRMRGDEVLNQTFACISCIGILISAPGDGRSADDVPCRSADDPRGVGDAERGHGTWHGTSRRPHGPHRDRSRRGRQVGDP